MKKHKLTVYFLEFAGKIHMNGTTREFSDFQVYYLDSRKKSVYTEFILSHLADSVDPTPSFLMRKSSRSIAATERAYYDDAKSMGTLFSDITTQVTKLGEL